MSDGTTLLGRSQLIEVLAEALLDEAAYVDEDGELIRDGDGCDFGPVTWACANDEGKEQGRRLARKALEVVGQWVEDPRPTAWTFENEQLVPLVELPPGFVTIRHDHLEADIEAILSQDDVTCISVAWHRVVHSGIRFTTVSVHGDKPSTIVASPDYYRKSTREVWDAAKEELEEYRKKVADGLQ